MECGWSVCCYIKYELAFGYKKYQEQVSEDKLEDKDDTPVINWRQTFPHPIKKKLIMMMLCCVRQDETDSFQLLLLVFKFMIVL